MIHGKVFLLPALTMLCREPFVTWSSRDLVPPTLMFSHSANLGAHHSSSDMAARCMIPSILVLANSFDIAGDEGSIEPLWYVSEEEIGREDGRGDISKM